MGIKQTHSIDHRNYGFFRKYTIHFKIAISINCLMVSRHLSNHISSLCNYLRSLCATALVMDYMFGVAAVVRNFSGFFSELINKSNTSNTNIFQIHVSPLWDKIDYLALIIVLFLTAVAIWSTKVFDEGNICEYSDQPHHLIHPHCPKIFLLN